MAKKVIFMPPSFNEESDIDWDPPTMNQDTGERRFLLVKAPDLVKLLNLKNGIQGAPKHISPFAFQHHL